MIVSYAYRALRKVLTVTHSSWDTHVCVHMHAYVTGSMQPCMLRCFKPYVYI